MCIRDRTVGYLAGLDGYEKADQIWDGDSFDTEFMLLCNLPESLLDRFLDEMQGNGLRIDHKAVVTEYNRDAEFHELIEEDVYKRQEQTGATVSDGPKEYRKHQG